MFSITYWLMLSKCVFKGNTSGQLEADVTQPRFEKCKIRGGARRDRLSGGGVNDSESEVSLR